MRAQRLAPLLALSLAVLLAPDDGLAQSNAQRMLDAAKQMRTNAAQMKGLPADARAAMITQAEEIEKGVLDGVYGDAPAGPKAPTNAERIAAAHGGQLEWLSATGACAGYTVENYLTFRYSPAINDRDSHCRNAYGHWATYQRVTRAGDAEAAETALFYYDAAAQRAVGLQGRK